MIDPLSQFEGRMFRRGDASYDVHRYQYAFSSHGADGHMEPASILYPTSTKDVLRAIEHASRRGLAIAVRTGGHHHTGASSTSGPNLLLDLRDTYRDVDWEPERDRVWVGVSHTLLGFDALLRERGLFLPHGQCGQVRLGGHVQTGGWGLLLRSFGLLADYVEAIRVVTADGKERVARRGAEDPDERDLFFAVLGGSPGNFGILTHVALRPLKDRDHPRARGLKFAQLYTPRRLRALLDLMAEMASDEDFDGDVDFCVVALGAASVHLPFASSRGIDEQMRVHHPEVYGHNEVKALPPSIVVFAQWANTRGAGQSFDPTFFRRIKAAAEYGASPDRSRDGSLLARLASGLHPRALFETVQNKLSLGSAVVGLSSDAPTSMSKLSRAWLFPNAREFSLPYVNQTHLSDSTSLASSRWAEWVSDRFDAIASPNNGCKPLLLAQHVGGKRSQFIRRGSDGATSHAWRRGSTVVCQLQCFYDERGRHSEASRQSALDWQAKNHEGAIARKIFSGEDRRLFWAPCSGDADLPSLWRHYYDSRETYDRLLAIKRRVDPTRIFSPNAFAIG